MAKVKVGIIGGSGLDDPDLLEDRTEKSVETPYGKPSDVLIQGRIQGVDCVLLARHGRKHTVNPSQINYRANVWALRQEGCTHLVVTTACGSLHELYAPGDIVFLDSFIDRTCKRLATFYDGADHSPKGVLHMPMHTPFCLETRQLLMTCANELGISYHKRGTCVTVEGPRFSSKAESKMFQAWGGHVINMTTVPEVALANELGMCYAAIALVTDYDCWRDEEGAQHVSVEEVLRVFQANASKAKSLILGVIPKIAERDWTDALAQRQDTIRGATMGVN